MTEAEQTLLDQAVAERDHLRQRIKAADTLIAHFILLSIHARSHVRKDEPVCKTVREALVMYAEETDVYVAEAMKETSH